MRKHLTLIHEYFEQEHFGKDVFLVPYYLGKALDCDVTIAYPRTPTNATFPDVVKGVRLVPLSADTPLRRLLGRKLSAEAAVFFPYLAKNAKKIDYLMLMHAYGSTFGMARLYKMFNPNGQLYLKLDGVYKYMEHIKPLKSFLGYQQYKSASKLKDYVDCVSIETISDFDYLSASPLPQLDFSDKLIYVPNGFDEESLSQLGIKERSFAEKENIIVTIGRLGTKQKNTEMLLDAIDGINLNGWRILLIGPIEDSFKPSIESFLKRNPDKSGLVLFTGPIYDKAKLFDIYSRAKVFILTSRWESSGLVLNEAFRLRDYIISTPVGAAPDIIGDNVYGEYVGIEDAVSLRDAIQQIVSGNKDINVYSAIDPLLMSYEHLLKPVAERLSKK